MALATPSSATSETQVTLAGLARALVQHRLLRVDEAAAIQKKADEAKIPFIDELVAHGPIKAPQLAKFAADTFGHPLLDLDSIDLPNLPADLIDKKLAGETRVIPLGRRGNRLSLAMSDPTDLQSMDRIKFQAEAIVDPIIVEHDKLLKVLEKFTKSASDQLSTLIDDSLDVEVTSDEQTAAQAADAAEVDDAPVVKFCRRF